MKKIIRETKGSPIPVRFKPSIEEKLRRKSIQEDRSLNYLIEKAVEKDLALTTNK